MQPYNAAMHDVCVYSLGLSTRMVLILLWLAHFCLV